MLWQLIVKPRQGIVAILMLASVDIMAAGLVLPPLNVDPENTNDEDSRPCQYTGDFKQERHLQELENPLVSTGSFLFSCNRGLLWEVRKPIADSRVYTSQKLNFRVRSNARVTQLHGIADSRTATLLLNFLSGDTTALAKDFDLISDAESPGKLILLPKNRSVKKRLTQLIVQQELDTVRITIQAPSMGDVVISIDNIAPFTTSDLSTCRQFSQQPQPNCSILIQPTNYVATPLDRDR